MKVIKYIIFALLPLQANALTKLNLDEVCLQKEPTNIEFFYTNGMLTNDDVALKNLSKVNLFLNLNKDNINLNQGHIITKLAYNYSESESCTGDNCGSDYVEVVAQRWGIAKADFINWKNGKFYPDANDLGNYENAYKDLHEEFIKIDESDEAYQHPVTGEWITNSYTTQLRDYVNILDSDPDVNMIEIAHSQGNMYWWTMFQSVLANSYGDRVRTISIGSPITIDDPSVVQFIDSKDLLTTLLPASTPSSNVSNSISNILDINLEGDSSIWQRASEWFKLGIARTSPLAHSVTSYIYGDDSSEKIIEAMGDFVTEFYPTNDGFAGNLIYLSATYPSNDNIEVRVLENFKQSQYESMFNAAASDISFLPKDVSFGSLVGSLKKTPSLLSGNTNYVYKLPCDSGVIMQNDGSMPIITSAVSMSIMYPQIEIDDEAEIVDLHGREYILFGRTPTGSINNDGYLFPSTNKDVSKTVNTLIHHNIDGTFSFTP
tara:strand:+ start:431 stop:1897 length:1467 start_codon:yes stop_codon:yes gene_type:complete